MPRVMQVSRPSAFTAAIIWATASMSLSLGLRQAAPMQKRVAPAALAFFAAATTVCTGSSASRSRPVS